MDNRMANAIAKALGQSSQTTSGRQGFHAGTGAGYQAARIKPETVESGLGAALQDFVKNGANAFASYESNKQATADERSNEIIRKLSPEQRRQAIGDGTLLYKDDPDAMQQLRLKSGRNAAYEVDSEVQSEIQKGSFRSRQELDEWRQTRMEQKSKSYAEMAGIDSNDTAYQKGFNADITKRSAAVYDLHSQYLSKNLETQAVLETRADLQPMLDDPKVLGNPASADHFAAYMNNGLTSGIFPSDAHAVKAVQLLASEAVHKEGGVQFLDSFGDKTINVYGGQRKVRDLLGPGLLDHAKAQAATSSYTRNAARTEALDLGLSNAIHHSDPATGWQMLQQMKSDNDKIQPGDQMTPQRQKIISAEQQLIRQVAQLTQASNIQLKTSMQSGLRQDMLKDAYRRKDNGELVSTDPDLMPTNEATGKFTPEDVANYANWEVNQINASSDTPELKTSKMLKRVREDRKEGPFRKIMGEFIDGAVAEWDGAVVSGQTQGDFPKLDKLRELSKADPMSIAMIYPEKAEIVAKLNVMSRYGVSMATAVEAEKGQKNLSPDERIKQDRDYESARTTNGSAMQYMPTEMNEMARTIYRANIALTNNHTASLDAVKEFVENNTTTLKTGGNPAGAIMKNDILMDPNDITSWKAGQSALQSKFDAFTKDHPELTTGGTSVVSRFGQLFFQTLSGKVEPIYMQDIRNETAQAAKKSAEEMKLKEQADIKRSQEGFKGYATDTHYVAPYKPSSLNKKP